LSCSSFNHDGRETGYEKKEHGNKLKKRREKKIRFLGTNSPLNLPWESFEKKKESSATASLFLK
jgi:hypothetical protein